MSFLQKAKEAAEQMAAQARQPGQAPASGWGEPPAGSGWVQPGQDAPAAAGQGEPVRTQVAAATEQAKAGLGLARKGLAGVIEKIDAGTMADIIIKATALQEKTNKALRSKGSPYRISEIVIAAALPPSVSFSIGRIDDPEEVPAGEEMISSVEMLEEAGVPATLEVDEAEIAAATAPA